MQRIEERRLKVQKAVEDSEILPKQEMVKLAGPMEEHTEEQKKNVKDLIKHYWAHTAKAPEEASAAASILRLLADEVEEQTYVALINAGTRPLIMMEVPQMASQVAEMKIERECQEKAKIYVISLLNRSLTSNLHKLVSGKKYHGGSHGESHQASSLKELEEHGEPMVQVIRKKKTKTTKTSTSTSATTGSSKIGGKGGRPKSSSKVTVMKMMPKLVSLLFLEDEIPAS